MRDYGKALRYLRRNKDYTQQDLAKMLNVAPQTVSKWENGVNQIDVESVTVICSIFDITTDEFIRLADGGISKNAEAAETSADVPETNAEEQIKTPSEKSCKGFSGFVKKAGLARVIVAAALIPIIVALSILAYSVVRGKRELSAEAIYKKVNPSVFYIEVDVDNGKQGGSGFFIDKNGTAVTNFHVIKGGTAATVTLADGNKYAVTQVIGCNVNGDIAIIRVDIPKSAPVSIGDSSKVKTGETVYAIGYPESFVLGSQESTYTSGIISKASYNVDGVNYIQTTADMTHGNSGGALVDRFGQVIGITSAKIDYNGITYMNLAIPANNIGAVKRNLKIPMREFSSAYGDVTVTYYNGNAVFKTDKCIKGGRVSEPDSAIIEGYDFAGWYEDAEFTTPFDFDKIIRSDTRIYGKWIEKAYFTVTYYDGNEVYKTQKAYDGNPVNPPSSYKYDHDFVGWYEDAELTVPFDFDEPIRADTAIYGKWTKRYFVITYYAEGKVYDTEKVYRGQKAHPSIYDSNDYGFDGWFSDEAFTVPFTDATTIDEDMTVYAKLTRVAYTVRFVEANGEYSEERLDTRRSETVYIPSPEPKLGYRFEGWENGGKLYDKTSYASVYSFNHDDGLITLTAKWVSLQYNVVYRVVSPDTGETLFEKTERRKSGEEFRLFDPETTIDGYYFTNAWLDGYKRYDINAPITNEDLGAYSTEEYEATVTLKAAFNGITYYIDLYDTYTGKVYETIEQIYGETPPTLRKYESEKPGYDYTWQVYNDDGTPYTGKLNKITTVHGKTVKAFTDYYPIKYEVIFCMDGKEKQRFELTYDTEFTVPEEVCEAKKGYRFVEYEIRHVGRFVKAGDILLNLATRAGDWVLLDAITEANSYTLNYDANGGTGNIVGLEAKSGETVKVADNSFEKVGYCFTGWKYGDKIYNEGDKVEFYAEEDEKIVFVAQWEAILAGGGTSEDPYKVTSYEDLVKVATMTRGGSAYQTAYYALTADIDCKKQNLKPIGDDRYPFRGIFDGRGYVISNAVFVADGGYQGLFGKVDGDGVLKNFGVKKYSMNGDGALISAPVAGVYASSQPIENVFAGGVTDIAITSDRSAVVKIVAAGGFIAELRGKAVNCYSESKVTVTFASSAYNTVAYVGGFVGRMTGEAEYCYANGDVSCNDKRNYASTHAGGFAGYVQGSEEKHAVVTSCFSFGNVLISGYKRYCGKSLGWSEYADLNDLLYDNGVVLTVDYDGSQKKNTVECTEGSPEESTRLRSVQWLIQELGFGEDVWTEEFGMPVLKIFSRN